MVPFQNGTLKNIEDNSNAKHQNPGWGLRGAYKRPYDLGLESWENIGLWIQVPQSYVLSYLPEPSKSDIQPA